MADERDSPDDLYPFAQMLVRKLIKKHGLRWGEHRIDDAEQELFLAGWQSRQYSVKLARDTIRGQISNIRATPALSEKQ